MIDKMRGCGSVWIRTTARLVLVAVAATSMGACQRAAAPAAPAETPAAAAEPLPDGVRLSALAPENLKKQRPPAPFDLTGNWFIDTEDGKAPEAWRFGPPYPKLTPAAQVHFDLSGSLLKEGKVYKDDIAQCYPAGLPLIMTRYWPMAMIQLPTAVYMVSGFMNSFRTVFLDGREHTEADVAIGTANGESVGRWDGDTMVVDTKYFVDERHWMDQGGRSIPAGDQAAHRRAYPAAQGQGQFRRRQARDRVHHDRPRTTGKASGRAPSASSA